MNSLAKKAGVFAGVFFVLPLSFFCGADEIEPLKLLDAYNVTWSSPSLISRDSMPLGNGDIGLNVWVEPGGDVLLYIGKSDAWDESCRLLKPGRIRLKFTPNLFGDPAHFCQTLVLRNGEIVIRSGQDPNSASLRIWVDTNNPAVLLETQSPAAFEQEVGLEIWRQTRRELKDMELHSACGMYGSPEPVYAEPDIVLEDANDTVLWCHHNRYSIRPQNLSILGHERYAEKSKDPLLHRTFGGMIQGDSFIRSGETTLQTKRPLVKSSVSVTLHTAISDSPDQWAARLKNIAESVRTKPLEQRRALHRQWWKRFWERSWIFASGTPEAEGVTRAYLLQRYVNACAGRGVYPIKFNGSLFTVDMDRDGTYWKAGFDADFRLWGGGYFWQNTRLLYWTMLKSGDHEMMRPLFNMYLEALPLAREHVQQTFGHEGAVFPEHMYFWGTQPNSDYGWTHKDGSLGENNMVFYYWQGGLELIAMMLDYYDYSRDAECVKTYLLPLARAVLDFYDQHYPRDKDGKILFEPAQSLETWLYAVNPLPEIAGLRFILPRLCALPDDVPGAELKQVWERMQNELPDIPTISIFREGNYKKVLVPAERFGEQANVENPELYAVFPYRIYGVGKPDIEIARLTYECRNNYGHTCWMQNEIHAACLGLAAEAKKGLAARITNQADSVRFPAWWKSPWETFPDQDGGCVLMIALQGMLMQNEASRIELLPAWPSEWNVQFKLHAPGKTTVEGEYVRGKMNYLNVTPSSRIRDVSVHQP